MALDGIILDEVEAGLSPPTLRFLRFDPPAVLVGYNQDVLQEARQDFCADQGIDINRRHTGGGAILFEPSMLGFEFFVRRGECGLLGGFVEIISRLGEMAAGAISRLGVNAQFRGRNDIEIDGRKVSGLGVAFLNRAFLFQGTLLIENCLDRMLRSLRVPVEKLKRREIESLLQRVTFLEDALGFRPDLEAIKALFTGVFAQGLKATLEPGGLTGREQERLKEELPFYRSDEWVRRREVKGDTTGLLRSQTGGAQVALWADLKSKRIKEAVIHGDFFARPQRLIMDLETALRGSRLKPEILSRVVDNFFQATDGELIGVSKTQLGTAIVEAGRRGALPWPGFTAEELNRIHPVGLGVDLEGWTRPEWLLLPYCAKGLICGLRYIDDCTACGECDVGVMYELARKLGLEPVTIVSFEHLMEVLGNLATRGESYIASCCRAFLAKHEHEMAAADVKGVVVAVRSLTCYDLGKQEHAYDGRFERQSELDVALFKKTVEFLSSNPATDAGYRAHGLAKAR